MTVHRRPSRAQQLAAALTEAGRTATPVENHLAVAVTTSSGDQALVWLPDSEGRGDAYVWGPAYQHEAALAGSITRTRRHLSIVPDLPALAARILETLK